MVTTADTYIETSEKRLSKSTLVGGSILCLAVGAVVGYFLLAATSVPDCCTILPGGKQGYKSGSSCLPLAPGKVCKAAD